MESTWSTANVIRTVLYAQNLTYEPYHIMYPYRLRAEEWIVRNTLEIDEL